MYTLIFGSIKLIEKLSVTDNLATIFIGNFKSLELLTGQFNTTLAHKIVDNSFP